MKKLLSLFFFIILISCAELNDFAPKMSCLTHHPTDRETYDAVWYYNNAGATAVSNPSPEVIKLFNCYYKSFDKIYFYKTFFHEGYILVRNYKPIISVETK